MESFLTYLSEDLKRLGKLKMPSDPLSSHRFKERGMNRKTLRQVPDLYRHHKTSMAPIDSLAAMVKGLDTSSRTVDIAKKAPSGVWRLSKKEVIDIARKYKFIIPNDRKPMKHLGSTGIQIVRYKPGMFYLYKPRRSGPRHYKKRSPFGRGHAKIIKGISAS
jgi:hypothetical protein